MPLQIEFEQAFETLYKLNCTICGDHDSKTARPRENRNGDIICHKCFDAKNCPECRETKPSDQFNGTLCRPCYAKKWENKQKQSSEIKECLRCRVTKSLGNLLGKLCRPCWGKDFWEILTQNDDKECPQCKKTKSASLVAGKICSICSNTNRRNKMAKKMRTCPQYNKQNSGDRFNGTLCGPCYKKNLHQKSCRDCTEIKTMCHMLRDEDFSSVWYLDGLPIVLLKAVLSKEEPDAICSTEGEGEGEEGKWWEVQDKKECEKE